VKYHLLYAYSSVSALDKTIAQPQEEVLVHKSSYISSQFLSKYLYQTVRMSGHAYMVVKSIDFPTGFWSFWF